MEKEPRKGARERRRERTRERERARGRERGGEAKREQPSARGEEKPAAGAGARVPVPGHPRREGTRDPPRG